MNVTQVINGQQIGARGVHYLPFVTLKNNLGIGTSKQSNGSTDAFGTLYPTNLNNVAGIGSVQTLYTNYFSTLEAGKGFDNCATLLANNALKYVTGENYFNKYKTIKSAAVIEMLKHKGVPTALSANAFGQVLFVVGLDSTRFIMGYNETSVGRFIVVGTIDSAGAITYGTPTSMGTITGNSPQDFTAVKINTDKIAMIYKQNRAAGTAGTYITCATFVGNAITLGTEGASLTSTNNPNYVDIVQNGTDKFQVAIQTTTWVTAAVTVAGTTLTQGATVTVNSTSADRLGMVLVSTDKFFFNYGKTPPTVFGMIVTVAGTVSTANTEVQISASATIFSKNCYLINSGTGLVMVATTGSSNFFLCTVSGSTFTVSPANTYGMNTTNMPTTSSNYGYIQEVTAGSLYNIYLGVNGGSSSGNNYVIQVSVSGNTVSVTTGAAITPFLPSADLTASFDPLDGQAYVVMGMVGTKMLACYKHANVLEYSSADLTATFDAYNDATLIGSYTQNLPFGGFKVQLESAVATGKKVYLGIKNTTGASKFFIAPIVTVEVE